MTASPIERNGSIELSYGADQYGPLVVLGFFGAAPVTTWLATLCIPLQAMAPKGDSVLGGIMIVLTLLAMLVAPWLVPCLVLRARQPRGARIEWNEEEIIEWDGPWRKTVIPWSQAELATKTWDVRSRVSTTTYFAVQLFARNGTSVITVWTGAPEGIPVIRRRLYSKSTRLLELAAKHHGLQATRTPDWSLASDPDRRPNRAGRILGRFGYVAAVFAPLLVPGATESPRSPVLALLVTAAAAGLLALRAAPSLREVQAIRARLRTAPAPGNVDAPYRGAGVRPDETDEVGRAAADRLKLRAATAEFAIRGSCVVLVLASTAAAFGFLK